MSKITSIKGYQRFDSRGNPTVKAIVCVGDVEGSALVPSGASTGVHEALELRDGEKEFVGKGVSKAIMNIQKIAKILKGIDVADQNKIDQKMIDLDGTDNKSNLGANAILAVSLACARAAASIKGVQLYTHIAETFDFEAPSLLPVPMMNILNGGAHTGWEGTDFQEFMIMPIGASSFSQAMQWGVETYQALKGLLKEKGYSTLVGDEGGFAPKFKKNEEAVEMAIRAIEKAGFIPGEQIAIALDPAVSELYDKETGLYDIKTEGSKLTSDEMIGMWKLWLDKYPIVSLEDGLSQDDWKGWTALTKELGDKVQIVGDDFLVTNEDRVKKAIDVKSCNSLLVKVNQIGTLSETIGAVKLCKENDWSTIISHRSGETEDSFISDLAVAVGAGQIKTGAPARSDRVVKYNRLLDIEEIYLEQSKSSFSNPFFK